MVVLKRTGGVTALSTTTQKRFRVHGVTTRTVTPLVLLGTTTTQKRDSCRPTWCIQQESQLIREIHVHGVAADLTRLVNNVVSGTIHLPELCTNLPPRAAGFVHPG